MIPYFSTALAVASNSTDAYVGKYWSGSFPEENGLGQYRVSKVNGTSQFKVINDFAGGAEFTTFGSGMSVMYNNALRSCVVGTLGLNPTMCTGAEYTGYTEFVYAHDTTTGNAAIAARQVVGGSWVSNSTFYAGLTANYYASMLLHTNAVGNPDPRIILCDLNSAKYSDAYPNTSTTWTTATTFYDGFAKYGFTSKLGITTAVGAGGRVRYTTDGVTWAGTTISGGTSYELLAVTWTTDGNTCIAAGKYGQLATSTDGQTFTTSTALSSTSWGTTRDVRAICADPASATTVYAVCGDGTIAKSTDYGVTWTVNTSCFNPNQRLTPYTVGLSPTTCWVQDGYLYVALYGGQVVRTATGGLCTDVSDTFNSYYSSFGTPDITGLYVDNSLLPTTTIRGMVAGGFGRVQYLLTGTPFALYPDVLLTNALISGSYRDSEVTCAYYSPVDDLAFVGLNNGQLAHRNNPLNPSTSWQIDTLPGVTGNIVGITRLPSGNYIAVADYQYVAVGSYSGGNSVSWAVNSSLSAYSSFTYAKQVVSDNSYTQVLIGAVSVARTTDGMSWTVSTLPSSSPDYSNVAASSLTYDPRASWGGGGAGMLVAFYEDTFYTYVATSAGGTFVGSNLGYTSTTTLPATGCFSFGTTPITVAIKPPGTGYLSTAPAYAGSWGSVPGVSNTNPSATPPAIPYFYYPSTPVLASAGAKTAVDVGIAVGTSGRIWFSTNP